MQRRTSVAAGPDAGTMSRRASRTSRPSVSTPSPVDVPAVCDTFPAVSAKRGDDETGWAVVEFPVLVLAVLVEGNSLATESETYKLTFTK